jgi:beta-glucanase (GH16 family)
MKRWWTLGVALALAVAVLWGLGVPGHAQPGGPEAPAAIAARAKAATQAAKAAQAAAFKSIEPKGAPDFSATFSGSRLNTRVWGTCYPAMNSAIGCTNFGNKDEYEWYLPSQDRVSGHLLKLVAQRMPTAGTSKSGSPRAYSCRSGMVTTYPSFHFKYGVVQVVANVPHRAGLWSGLWLAAANGVWPPEIDILENWGVDTLSGSFFHPAPATAKHDRGLVPVQLTTGWQTYTLEWTKSSLTVYVGTEKVLNVTSRVPHQQMYFLANVAEYQPVNPEDCDGTLKIRSVRIWKG